MSEELTVQELTMEQFELTEEVWNSLSDDAQRTLIDTYMKTSMSARNGEPETNRVCEFKYISDGKVIFCEYPSTVRVKKYSDIQILQDDDTWKTERTEEYLCKNHFDRKYTYNEYCTSKDLGKWTYKRFKSSIKTVKTSKLKEVKPNESMAHNRA